MTLAIDKSSRLKTNQENSKETEKNQDRLNNNDTRCYINDEEDSSKLKASLVDSKKTGEVHNTLKDKTKCCHVMNARTILWYLMFTGFAVNYIIRINLNIAIVSMVKSLKPVNDNSSNTVELTNESNYEDTFDWTDQQQNVILGAFFWVHWCTTLLGGILALRYGTKQVFGLSNFIPTVLCFFIPLACSIDYRMLIGIRVLQGLFTGISWPAMNCLITKWSPPYERSRFVSSFYGSSVGIGTTYFMGGFITNYLGWRYVFYITGFICVLWYICWCLLVYETPQQHPWISSTERKYILDRVENSADNQRKLSIPWKNIVKSRSLWIATYTYWGILWSIILLQTYMPLYFKVIHQLNSQQIGIVLSLPNISKWLFSFVVAAFIDCFIKKRIVGTTNARKIAVTLSTAVQALVILVLAIKGSDSVIVAITAITVATTLQGASSSGLLASLIDMSPNFCSILYGICSMIACTSGFIIPYIISFLLQYKETAMQWRNSFFIVAGILILTNVIYVAFGNSELQEWNSEKPKRYKEIHDLETVCDSVDSHL